MSSRVQLRGAVYVNCLKGIDCARPDKLNFNYELRIFRKIKEITEKINCFY